jgi:hypothetical protein
MQKEKLAAILLAVIIIGALVTYLFITYGDEIIENLTGDGTEEPGIIEIGDCADVNYIGRFALNNSIFESSYNDVENKSDGIPINVFISFDLFGEPPEGYEAYSSNLIEGFMEGLIGLTEGETTTIGPIPPEKAYGVKPKVGDVILFPGQTSNDQDLRIDIVGIIENTSMPEEFIGFFGNITTTLYNLRANYSVGDEILLYPSWAEDSIVTKVNETMLWTYTTPSEDQRENFTWVDNISNSEFWDSASSVSSIDDTTIIVTHSPDIGATMQYSLDISNSITYTVVNLTDDKINVSYLDNTGNTSYTEFDRNIVIKRNVSQVTIINYPKEGLEQLLTYLKFTINPDIEFSLDPYADLTLLYEIEVVEVYKTSKS